MIYSKPMFNARIDGSCEHCGLKYTATIKMAVSAMPKIHCPICHRETLLRMGSNNPARGVGCPSDRLLPLVVAAVVLGVLLAATGGSVTTMVWAAEVAVC